MERELKVHMDFYLVMQSGETEDQAKDRFDVMMKTLENVDNQESSFQVYKTEVQEC